MQQPFNKFLLLLWKNWVLQYRRPIRTVFEILSPIVFSVVVLIIRSLVDPKKHQSVVYEQFCTLTDQFFFKYSICSENEGEYIKPEHTYYRNFKLIYSPRSPALQEMVSVFFAMHFDEIEAVEDSTALGDLFRKNHTFLIFAVLQFDDSYKGLKDFSNIKNIKVSIRFPADLRKSDVNVSSWNWETGHIFPTYQTIGPRLHKDITGGIPNYHGEGFLTIQHYLTIGFVAVKLGLEPIDLLRHPKFPLISMRRYPYPEWYEDLLQLPLQILLSIIMILSFVYPCINIVRSITTEKEKQLKESMKIMGLPSWLHWTAWFIKYFVFLLISSILIVFLLKIKWYRTKDFTVFTFSDPSVIIFFFMFYISATITYCFAISAMFNKANTAATVAGLVWFLSSVPYMLSKTQFDRLGLMSKLVICLFSNSALGYGLQTILSFEMIGAGVQWVTLFKPFNPDDELTLGLLMGMLAVDAFIYLFVAIYVEAVFPGEYGVPKPWYFLCSPSYWRTSTPYRQDSELSFFGNSDTVREFFEPEPSNLRTGIQITNLRKVFRKKAAVEDLTLNMYEDQITVLLGHNGAGKTTTMSMLTGMITPTSGTAKVNGYDIRTEIDGVRQSMGLCPQHNIIFDYLTVEEHLYFFSRLKGLPKREIKEEIDKYIKLLNLEDKRHSKSKTLSGGMKRKLCVGMALCGNSEVVMLDEPTSGMDPSARRALWMLLKEQKKGRTILLSTHFMDEADILGDRIAIMASGKLQCCGSSFFLKKKFGEGYSLVMEKSQDCDPARVTALLQTHIPGIEIQSTVGSELVYLLEQSHRSKFEPMLRDLENNSKKLGILGYGIALTTMEDVFMKVDAEGIKSDKRENQDENVNQDTNLTIGMHPQFTGGVKLVGNQFMAMFMKRFLATYRSWPLLLIQMLVAITFVIIPVLYIRGQRSDGLLPPLEINLRPFYKPITLVEDFSNNSEYVKWYLDYLTNHSYGYEKTKNLSNRALELIRNSPVKAMMSYIVGATFDKEGNEDHITAWFNNDAYHSPGISLSLVLNAALRKILNCNDCSITFINHPMPYELDTKMSVLLNEENLGYVLGQQQGLCMAFISSFYLLFIVKERASKSKHLQLVSGVKVLVFWLTTVIWDMLTFLLVSLVVLATYASFQEDGFKTGPQLGRVLVLLLTFGWSFLPMVYIASNIFQIPSSGFTKLVIFNTATGVVAFLLAETLTEIPTTEATGNNLKGIFLIFPHFSYAMGLHELYRFQVFKKICKRCNTEFCHPKLVKPYCTDIDSSVYMWKSPGIGRCIFYSLTVGLILYLVHLSIEFKLFIRLFYFISKKRRHRQQEQAMEEDDDVVEEKRKIKNATQEDLQSYALALQDLTKYYNKFLAVNSLCLGIRNYECFGLLGANGAGKTTTFRMMTGDVMISYGDAFVNGLSIKHQFKKVHRCIGYCPQCDALLDDMTAKETIVMFALLRGICYSNCNRLADALAKEFDFSCHLKKQVKALSGGNKRKLSSAVATIGNPPVIYFDEPTTGMDPATKRYLWNVLCKIRDSGKCLVLTSHSMEECEALCTRMVIMVSGQFKCLGSAQHLKNKFAKGYNLTIKLKKSEGLPFKTGPIEQFVQSKFPTAQLTQKHEELLYYHVKDMSQPWSEMFAILETAKKDNYNIEDYFLDQNSLEQVFLAFTRQQT